MRTDFQEFEVLAKIQNLGISGYIQTLKQRHGSQNIGNQEVVSLNML